MQHNIRGSAVNITYFVRKKCFMMSDMFRWKNPEIPAELGCFPEMDFFFRNAQSSIEKLAWKSVPIFLSNPRP